jgi:hypothetical protein
MLLKMLSLAITLGLRLLVSSVIGQRMYLETFHHIPDPLTTMQNKKVPTSIGHQVCRPLVTLRSASHSVWTSEKWRLCLLPANTRTRISGKTMQALSHLYPKIKNNVSAQTQRKPRSNQQQNERLLITSPIRKNKIPPLQEHTRKSEACRIR